MSIRPHRFLSATVLVAAVVSASASAQTWPNKPVRLVIPFPPGGINDVIGRGIGQRLSEQWGHSVIIDNRGGAGSVIGTEVVAKSAPDGHTLLLISAAHAINVTLQRKLPYDSVRDFTPVTYIGWSPFVLVVHPSLPVRSVKELVALAKARPDQIAFSSSGTGTSVHLMGAMLGSGTGIKLVHVPYKGIAPAITDLIAGQVQFSFASPLTSAPHVKSGRLRPIAVTSPQRARTVQELPTIAESGIPGYRALAWYGILAPGATPKDIVERASADIIRTLKLPELNDRLTAQGVELVAGGPSALAEHLRNEITIWGKAVKEADAKAD
jgi:tripartite-type tricarboxylate transporter receptor subunit TctC